MENLSSLGIYILLIVGIFRLVYLTYVFHVFRLLKSLLRFLFFYLNGATVLPYLCAEKLTII